MENIKHIMVAVDGSEGSMLALNTAETAAKNNEAKLTVVYVDQRPGETKGSKTSIFSGDPNMRHKHISYDPAEKDDGEFRTAKKVLTDAMKAIKESIEVEYQILFGSPSEEIIYYAEKSSVDMIMIGKHGHSGFKKLMMGSVSSKVANKAACSVVIVR